MMNQSKRTNAHRPKTKGQGQMVSFTILYEYQRLGLLPVTCNVQYRLLGADPE